MLEKAMYKRIKQCRHKGYSKKKTSKELSLDRKTVGKYWNMSESEYLSYLQQQLYRDKSFDELKNDILSIYEANTGKKLNATAVYDFLEEKYSKLPASEKSLRNYIKYLLETKQIKLATGVRAYQKVAELPYGEQLQIDFGVFTLKSGLKLYIFAAVLSASRYKYIGLQDVPFTTLTLIEHLLDCFDYLEGRPCELVIDQDTVMVVSENHGDIIFTKDFAYFKEEMGLRVYTCRKADPESKGKIENVVKYVKSNFLAVRDFESLEDARLSLALWLVRRGNGKLSQATKRIPNEMFLEEQSHLRPVKNSIYRKHLLIGRETRSVGEKSFLSFNGSQYSVPVTYRNKEVDIYPTDQELFIFDKNTGTQIAAHSLALSPGERVLEREHFRETSKRVKELKEETLNLFEVEVWKQFCLENFKSFPRYVRDQCILAKKYFCSEIDSAALNEALSFCLENRTYSYKNLFDTYTHYLANSKEAELARQPVSLPEIKKAVTTVNVPTRQLEVYASYLCKAREERA